MFRRLFVSVLVAALTLAVAPRPASGLGGDHFRCMYRCKERTQSYRPPPRSSPVRPLRHACSCGWGQGGWGHGGWGSGGHGSGWGGGWHGGHNGPDWYGDGWYHRPSPWDRWDRWNRRGWGRYRWHRWDRHRWDDRDRWERRHDPSRDSGYNAHRHHPRGRDF